MINREKRPVIDERMRNIILSRIFGEHYCQRPDCDYSFLGYFKGAIVAVWFTDISCTVEQKCGEYGTVKFGNLVANTFFNAKGLRCSTWERIPFDKDTCAHMAYDKEDITFYFWYRDNRNK